MQGPYTHDNRRFARYQTLECAVLFVGADAEPIRVIVADVGLGGVQLRSRIAIPLDCPLELQVGRNGKEPLRVKGKGLYSHPGEPPLYVSGFCFVPETHQERLDVAEYVHELFQKQFDALAG